MPATSSAITLRQPAPPREGAGEDKGPLFSAVTVVVADGRKEESPDQTKSIRLLDLVSSEGIIPEICSLIFTCYYTQLMDAVSASDCHGAHVLSYFDARRERDVSPSRGTARCRLTLLRATHLIPTLHYLEYTS